MKAAVFDGQEISIKELPIPKLELGPFDKAIKLLSTEVVQVNQLISKLYPLDNIKEAFNSYEKNQDHIKTIILI